MRPKRSFSKQLDRQAADESNRLRLEDGSSVAVVGGGPAGSFFSYFLLKLATNVGMDLQVDLYEPRDYSCVGPQGCNHCGGIISESLVQLLATEGINLPPSIVRRGIDSYTLHTDVGSVRLETPLHEKRIAAVYRGAGPRGSTGLEAGSFDRYLQDLAFSQGTRWIRKKVSDLSWADGRPVVSAHGALPKSYDLIVGAVGVNSGALKLFESASGYKPPGTTKTFICEFLLGEDRIQSHMGPSMHVFLLNIPRLEFAAFIPKGDYLTLVLLGEDIDRGLVHEFLESPEVKGALPPQVELAPPDCKCSPKINVRCAVRPFRDRMVLIGDCGVTRLYKDGIGAAYRTAKAAASTAVLEGISERDFRRYYGKACRTIDHDNTIGKAIFLFTRLIQKRRFARRAMLSMVSAEQRSEGSRRTMSTVLWDMFTGSAPYREVFVRTLHPLFLGRLGWSLLGGALPMKPIKQEQEGPMKQATLGKLYQDGEAIVREGEAGDCMYVIQSGKVEVVQDAGGRDVRLAVLGEGEVFGEMAIFERQTRSATVRAQGEVHVLTVDKRTLLRRFQEDPSLAFRIVEVLSHRVRALDAELTRLKA